MYIKPAPIRWEIPNIFSALKNLSAINPIMNGATIAPIDWVENAAANWPPLAWRLLPKKVPKVTYQDPQTKNSKNIMRESLNLLFNVILIGVLVVSLMRITQAHLSNIL